MKSISFSGVASSDCECFCWDKVTPQMVRLIAGEGAMRSDRLYPDDILLACGCEDGRRYRFTVSVEEVADVPETEKQTP